MLDGSLTHKRRQTLAWDSQTTRDRNAGRYIRERSGAPYNTSRWHKLAKAFIEDHPLCEECKRKGIIKAAECVDHIDPWPICEEYFFEHVEDISVDLSKDEIQLVRLSDYDFWGKVMSKFL